MMWGAGLMRPAAPAADEGPLYCDQSATAPVAMLDSPGCICTVNPYPPVTGNQGRIGVLRDDCPARGHGRKP